jgi:hypothetical protein
MIDIQEAIKAMSGAYVGIDNSIIIPEQDGVESQELCGIILDALCFTAERQENQPLMLEGLNNPLNKYDAMIADACYRIGSYIAGGNSTDDPYIQDQITKIRQWEKERKAGSDD